MEGRGMSLTRREDMYSVATSAMAETATSAVQMQQKVVIESRLTVALKIGRDWDRIALRIDKLCNDPDFAAEALYAKPIGKLPQGYKELSKREQLIAAPENWPRGFSIRAIEAFIAEAGHFDSTSMVIWDDEEKVITNVTVWDLCTNNTESRMVMTPKTKERKELKKGQEHFGTRLNTYGDVVFIVAATAADVEQARAAEISKVKRTMAEKMFRADYRRQWRNTVEATIRSKDAADPEQAKKQLLSAFYKVGIEPNDISEYLDHKVDVLQPAELVTLRALYVGITNNEFTWKDVMNSKYEDGDPEERQPTEQEKKLADRLRKATAKPGGDPVATQGAPGSQAKPEPLPWQDVTAMQIEFTTVMNSIGKMNFDAICKEHNVKFADVKLDQTAVKLYRAMQAKEAEMKKASESEPAKADPGKSATEAPKPSATDVQGLRDLEAKHGNEFWKIVAGEHSFERIEDIPPSKLKAIEDQVRSALEPAPEAATEEKQPSQEEPPRRGGRSNRF